MTSYHCVLEDICVSPRYFVYTLQIRFIIILLYGNNDNGNNYDNVNDDIDDAEYNVYI